MSHGRKFPQTAFDRVHAQVNLAKERMEDGPSNMEWLLDFNLPDLYRAIGELYEALGETDRLDHDKQIPPEASPAGGGSEV